MLLVAFPVDFGGSPTEVALYIRGFLTKERQAAMDTVLASKWKLQYHPYCWDSNDGT